MSDQQIPLSTLNEESQSLSDANPREDDEFEEITSDEVDRIVAALDELIETCHSENIKYYLEDAAESIYHLVYEEEDVADDDDLNEAA